jgi:putative hemolysin
LSIESIIIQIVIILFLIILNGFFSTSEIAIITARRSVMEKLAKDGNHSAALVIKMKDDPERYLATIQVGVTFIGTLASVIGGVLAIELLVPVFNSVPIALISDASEFLAISCVVIILSYSILVLGELVPKSLALRYTDKIACFSARPIMFLSKTTGLLVSILTGSTSLVLRIFGIKGAPERVFLGEDEIKFIIQEGKAKGEIEETEAALLHGVFEFADMTAKEIMVAKPQMSAINIDTPTKELLSFLAETGYSRYPVYKENLDHIEGIIYNKDVFKMLEQGKDIVLSDVIREAYFVPSSIKISRLLREMQQRRIHIAIAVDEHGDVDGVVTIEDILEEIVGEIEDEFDVENTGLIERMKDGTMIIEASATLKDLGNEGLEFTAEEVDEHGNLAGFMLAELQRIPRGGEFVINNHRRFTVVDMEDKRIAKVKVEMLLKKADKPEFKKVSE